MPTAIGNYQPVLVLTETIATQGIFPAREGGGGGAMTLAMFHTYGFNFGMAGAPMAAGQLLPIAQNTAVFSLLGTTYGGNGQTTFALPDLRGRAANGDGQGAGLPAVQLGEQTGAASTVLTQQQMPASLGGSSAPVDENQPELGIKYIIQALGAFPSETSGSAGLNMIGLVTKFAGNFAPAGWLECAGQLVNIDTYPDLFNLIGTLYGGDGVTTFRLPDLRGRTIVGAGGDYALSEVFGQEDVTITQANLPLSMGGNGTPIHNREPSVALNYIIALQGIFPSPSGGPDETVPFLGELLAFAGNFAPRGFAFAHGQLLPINQNQALFSLLGTMYGGNGQTTFALPDLRDRAVLGQGNGFLLSETFGSDFTTLDLNHIPDLNYAGTDAAGTHYGGNGNDIINALGGDDTITAHGGNDFIDGGAGGDALDGGAGFDLASWLSQTSGLTLNLANQALNAGSAAGDTVANIEAFYLTNSADTFTAGATGVFVYGFGGSDTLTGSSQPDFIDGGPGGDTIDAGGGFDYVSYNSSTAAVTLNLQTPAANTGDAASDMISNADAYILTEFADTFIGLASGQNIVFGFGGNDTLTGGFNANNWFFGGDGDDRMAGGGGADLYVGGTGADSIALATPTPIAGSSVFGFETGVDQIEISRSVFGLSAGYVVTPGTTFVSGAAPVATVAAPTFFYYTNLGLLYFDPDGTGATAASLLMQMAGASALAASDFHLV